MFQSSLGAKSRRTLALASVSLATMIWGAAAKAQTVATPPAATATTPDQPAALAEVVVTARRQSENLQKTPVAVTALSPDILNKKSILSEQDLQSSVPGLTVRTSQNSNQINFALRGQSVDSFSASQPAVLTYVDEVQATNNTTTPFYDLGSIQVLKGPQGTLFGRNATGGAVLFTSAQPVDHFEGFLTGRFGDYAQEEYEGAVNLPIVPDKVLLRVAADYQRHDGYSYNLFDDSTVGNVLREGARISLLTHLSDQLSNTVVVDYTHSGGTNLPAVAYSAYGPGSTNNGVALDSTGSLLFSPALDSVVGVPGAYAAYLAAHPGAYPGGLDAFVALQQARGPYLVDIDSGLHHRADSTIVSNITTYRLSDTLTFKNIVGYGTSISNDEVDFDGTPYLIQGTTSGGDIQTSTSYSEEFQLLGKLLSDRLNYVAGFYYSNQTNDQKNAVDVFDLAPIIPVTLVLHDTEETSVSYAGYVQGTYDLSGLFGVNGLSFTGGVRYTSDRSGQRELPGSVFYNTPGEPNNEAVTVNKPSYQVGVQEQLNPSLLLYVVTRHSFRSGGFNGNAPPVPATADQGGNLFLPEITDDVEVGAKYQGRIASIPVRLNAATYYQWVDDAQRTIYAALPTFGLSALTINVPKSQIDGFELDGQVSPTKWLNLGANAALTDPRFTSNMVTVFGQTAAYGPYADTPKWTGSIYAEVTYPLPQDIGRLSVRSDAYAQSKFFFSNLNNTVTPDTEIGGYNIINFRVGVDNVRDSPVSVAFYLLNAFNHVYYTGGFAAGNVLSVNAAVPGAPRTFYGEVHYKF